VTTTGSTYVVSDSATNILNGYSTLAAKAADYSAILLSQSANNLSVGQTQTLFDGAPGDLNVGLNGHNYTISDSVAAFLANATDAAVTGAGVRSLSASTVNLLVNQAQTFRLGAYPDFTPPHLKNA
jgi:hypothetical protein